MNVETISVRQGIILVFLFLLGSTVLVGTGGAAKKDMWLAMILAIILAIPLVMFYSKLLATFPGKNLFEITEQVFGKFLGKLIVFLYTWYALHLGAMVMDNFGEFINIVGLPETPRAVPVIFFAILSTWVCKEGVEVLGRWGQLFLSFILGITMVTVFFSVVTMDINKVRPILEEGIPPLIKGTFGIFAFPYGEVVILTMITPFYENKKSIYKIYVYGVILGGLTLLMYAVRNLLTIGPDKIAMHYYPSYIAVGRINIGEFIQRAQILITVAFLIAGFMKISVCLLATVNGVAKLFNLGNYRLIVTPVAILMFNLSFIVYENILETIKWAPNIYPYYAFSFQVILPLVTYIVYKIRIKDEDKIEENTV
jgi:spore germination protein KB